MTAVFGVCTVLLVLFLAFVIREYDADKSRWFIERQQMQSKIDTLTEQLLQRAGVPIDLNKRNRDVFRSLSRDNAFKHGWAMDKPATPGKA